MVLWDEFVLVNFLRVVNVCLRGHCVNNNSMTSPYSGLDNYNVCRPIYSMQRKSTALCYLWFVFSLYVYNIIAAAAAKLKFSRQ